MGVGRAAKLTKEGAQWVGRQGKKLADDFWRFIDEGMSESEAISKVEAKKGSPSMRLDRRLKRIEARGGAPSPYKAREAKKLEKEMAATEKIRAKADEEAAARAEPDVLAEEPPRLELVSDPAEVEPVKVTKKLKEKKGKKGEEKTIKFGDIEQGLQRNQFRQEYNRAAKAMGEETDPAARAAIRKQIVDQWESLDEATRREMEEFNPHQDQTFTLPGRPGEIGSAVEAVKTTPTAPTPAKATAKVKGKVAGAEIIEVPAKEFFRNISKFSKQNEMNSANIHPYTQKEYSGMRTFMSKDGKSGYALKKDGELVSVHSSERGRGDALVSHAVKMGATKLDAYDIGGKLPALYGKHGFVETGRSPFDPQFADPKNKLLKERKPDFVEMVRASDKVKGKKGPEVDPEDARPVLQVKKTPSETVAHRIGKDEKDTLRNIAIQDAVEDVLDARGPSKLEVKPREKLKPSDVVAHKLATADDKKFLQSLQKETRSTVGEADPRMRRESRHEEYIKEFGDLTPQQRVERTKYFRTIFGVGVPGALLATWIMSDDEDKVSQEQVIEEAMGAKTPEEKAAATKVSNSMKKAGRQPTTEEMIQTALGELKKHSGIIPDTETRTDWEAKLKKLRDAYDKRETKIEGRKRMENIIHGIVQMFASLYGLSTGLGIGTLEFDKTNWQAHFDRNLKQLGLEERALESAQRLEEAQIKAKLARMDEEQKRKFQIAMEKLKNLYDVQRQQSKQQHEKDMERLEAGTKKSKDATKLASAKKQDAGAAMAYFRQGSNQRKQVKVEQMYRQGVVRLSEKWEPRVINVLDSIVEDDRGRVDEEELRMLSPILYPVLLSIDVATDPRLSAEERAEGREALLEYGYQLNVE